MIYGLTLRWIISRDTVQLFVKFDCYKTQYYIQLEWMIIFVYDFCFLYFIVYFNSTLKGIYLLT